MKRINHRSENKKNSNLKLISSAIKNISQKGINETTMLDVSQGAGLSHEIVNFHFKSKELLLIETYLYYIDKFTLFQLFFLFMSNIILFAFIYMIKELRDMNKRLRRWLKL